MQGDEHPTLVLLRSTRERVLAILSEGFTKDEIGLDEFERRVDGAYAATSIDALDALVRDLSAGTTIGGAETGSGALSVRPESAMVASSAALAPVRREKKPGTVAIFASVERRGAFSLSNGSRAVAIFGNVELDLRQVALPDGVTELFVRAVFGNVEITVPPDLAVECEGSGVLGSFSSMSRVPAEGRTRGPVLRVIGSAVLGNVEIHTRPRNEPAAGYAKLLGAGPKR
jgi:hypothetical protein